MTYYIDVKIKMYYNIICKKIGDKPFFGVFSKYKKSHAYKKHLLV